MLESINTKHFEYKKLSEAEQKARGILGRLVGPCADFNHPTRNGRKYSEQLWENVFNSDIMKEKIANKCCFGELNHPTDRSEIDMEKVAICLAEQPKKGKDGRLYGVFDILSTPNGRILKALCDYGCKIGISSRGQGDLITDANGDEAVDPDTYDCECFDAVLIPGVEAARLTYVTESLNTKGKKLKKALTEALDSETIEGKKTMLETLTKLNINITESEDKVDDQKEPVENQDVATDNTTALTADDDLNDETTSDEEITDITDSDTQDTELEIVDNSVVDEKEIQQDIFLDFLVSNFDEKQIKKVCKILNIEIENLDNSEEADNIADSDSDEEPKNKKSPSEEDEQSSNDVDIDAKKDTEEPAEDETDAAIDEGVAEVVKSLKEALKVKSELENSVKDLQENLAVSDAKVEAITEECNRYKKSITRLAELNKTNAAFKEKVSKLEESLKQKTSVIETQKARITRLAKNQRASTKDSAALNEGLRAKESKIEELNTSISTITAEYDAKIKSLNEEFKVTAEKQENTIQTLTEDLTKITAHRDSYKNLANKAVNKYIEVKAETLGLAPSDIKVKLGESYTLSDVDQVCRDLRSYQLNISKLPFSIDRSNKISVKVNESVNSLSNQISRPSHIDDDVDDTLMRIANLDNY